MALLASRFNRLRRPRKSSGPPPFAPSLKIQGDDAHNNSVFGDLALGRQTASRSCANGQRRNCVPNKDSADFQQVLESGHTIEERRAGIIAMRSVRCSSWVLAHQRVSKKGALHGRVRVVGAEQRRIVLHVFGVGRLREEGAAHAFDP